MTVTKESFETIARALADDLRVGIPLWGDQDIAACIGNLGYECNGFQTLQEISPAVAGSRGGLGYGQWTGARRRAFEAFCASRGLDTGSLSGNRAYLLHELLTSQRGAVGRTRAGKTLRDKVVAFELAFEAAGVKNYDSRLKWASRAMDAVGTRAPEPPEVEALKPKPPHASMAASKTGGAAIATGASVVTAAGAAGNALNQAKDAVSNAGEVKDNVQSAGELVGFSGSMALIAGLALVALACLAFIWWDRRQKLRVDGV